MSKPKEKPVTLKTVAKDAGVSHITVSRVFNSDAEHCLVSEQTREKVLASVRKLNYRPFAVARAMRTHRTGIIALVYCRDDFEHFGSDMFYLGVQGGIEEVLGENDKGLLIGSVTRKQLEKGRLPVSIQQGLVDAVLIYEISEPALLRELASLKLPIVSINAQASGGGSMDSVSQDNFAAFKEVTEHILDLGHRSIGLVTSNQYVLALKRREEGFLKALEDRNLSFREELKISANPWMDEGGERAVEFMKRDPSVTAFMCTSDGLAVAVINALQEAGWKVPEDVSVVGCGGHYPWRTMGIGLTTVRFGEEQLGQMAATVALDRLNGKGAAVRVEIQKGEFVPGMTAGECRTHS